MTRHPSPFQRTQFYERFEANCNTDFIHADQNNMLSLYRLSRLLFLGMKYHFLGTNFHIFETRNSCQHITQGYLLGVRV